MPYDQTNLNTIADKLTRIDVDLPLIFTTDESEIGAGYHVTELKQITITGIDCGGNIDDWKETHLQLLDGSSGEHMRVKKFASIVKHSINSVEGLGEAPLFVEFAPANKGLRRYTIDDVSKKDTGIYVSLAEDRARCKPAAVSTGPSCC